MDHDRSEGEVGMDGMTSCVMCDAAMPAVGCWTSRIHSHQDEGLRAAS